ncbi:MAG TPA: GNAT family N-acetyltransferase [Methanocella sp.]|uniref:GNAT family N-acetyltransferase n=1 Tax=Methanocella sp. TaxID=2052833 RepID=UPI002D1AE13C|nr:GNAT family N-acetyltransferase [Methanocella sp.]HTY91876.1 GNAT family N-acetyltransferase [Methanocella sp.]
MTIEIISDKGQWDGFIEESPYGMLFHRWDYLKTIEKYIGYDLLTYGIFKGSTLIGVLPLFYKKKGGIKLVYSPPPGTLTYTPYMGLVMGDIYATVRQRKKESYLDLAWNDVSRELKRLAPNYVSITFVPDMNDIRPMIWDGYNTQLLYTYLIDLDRPLDDMWNDFESDCKKNIRSCEKYDLTIMQTSDVDTFYSNMGESLKAHGKTFFRRQDSGFLKELIALFPDNIKLYFLYRGSEVLGMTIDCMYKGLYMGWCGDNVINRDLKVNEYLEWEKIKAAKSEGYKCYENWGGDMKRLNVFKSKFNPKLMPYYHVKKLDAVGKLSDFGYGMLSSISINLIKR